VRLTSTTEVLEKKIAVQEQDRTKRYLHNKLCYRSRSAVQYHKLAIRPETIQQSKLYLILWTTWSSSVAEKHAACSHLSYSGLHLL